MTAAHPLPAKKTSPRGFPVLTHQEDLLPGLRGHPLGHCHAPPMSFSGLSPTACPSGISDLPGGLRSDSQCVNTADCLCGLHAPLFRSRLSHLCGSNSFFFFHSVCVLVGQLSREGNGTPLQYSCLENPMDGGAWWAAVMGSLRVGHD